METKETQNKTKTPNFGIFAMVVTSTRPKQMVKGCTANDLYIDNID